jgi:nitroimidazol reductase NimA-like FMN-containing flavoprotein (pyridoxamine 5'-phosphate oxidase superfamily)
VRPDDPVVREVLANSFVARVATRSRSGAPALTPLWFVVDAGRLFMATGAATLAARNARACPEIAVLLDGEAAGPRERVLLLRGRATVRDAMPSWRVLARMAWKYYVGGLGSELWHARLWRLRQRYYAQAEAAVIDFAPERATWMPTP